VVQLDPASDMGRQWGPQLVVVTEPKPWGFQGYMLHAAKRGEFGPAYLRIKTGTFEPVGRVVWMVGEGDDG
jgi:hypothetical protein